MLWNWQEAFPMKNNILVIDNFDSFIYNLVDEFEKIGFSCHTYRNNVNMKAIEKAVSEYNPKLIIVSPGPSHPRDAGISIDVIKEYYKKIPIFGVCLGHQAMIEAFGGYVERCKEIVHGKASDIYHDGKTIYEKLPSPFKAGRYHSLTGTKIPDCFEVSARTESDIVMGVRMNDYPVEGVQFHPESILTPEGRKIIENIGKII